MLDPDGRIVVLRDAQWAHIREAHPEMARYEGAVMAAVTHALHREDDVRAGRERFFAPGIGPARWLRVIVDYRAVPALVVTAFGQDDSP